MDKCAAEAVGYVHGVASCVDEICNGNGRLFVRKTERVVFEDVMKEEEEEDRKGEMKNFCSADESSSSIGKNSDLSENSMEKSGDGEEEVQSSYKSPFDSLGALEDVLPMRRGISSFYNGKSKSYTSLADASSSSSSIKDLAKPDNSYNKKRRNLLAHKIAWDKTRSSPLRSKGGGGGISKRVTSSRRTSLALAVAMNNFNSDKRAAAQCDSFAVSSSPVKDFCYWRSFSLADLQQCVPAAATPCSSKPSSQTFT